jgi:hypothetical protein
VHPVSVGFCSVIAVKVPLENSEARQLASVG